MKCINAATYLFEHGYSCSQSILAGFGPEFGLDQETCFRLGRAFGSGLGLGATCGALSGAFVILGFLSREEEERRARYETYDRVRELIRRFEAIHGTIVCRDLLGGVDLGTETGVREAVGKNLFTTICPRYVRGSAEILSAMIKEARETAGT